MFDSKSPLSKYVGYLLIGFFLLIIILSFGMPDMGLNLGKDPSTVAIINGQKVHALDFIRYRDTKFSRFRNQKLDSFILDNFIYELLFVQKAEDYGFNITEERLTRHIKDVPDFKNPSSGQFDPNYFQAILKNNRLSLSEFEKILRRDLTFSDFRYAIYTGSVFSKEDINAKNTVDDSAIQIQYAFLSAEDMKKKYQIQIQVTDKEIDDEITGNKVKITDPKTDRDRIKRHLEEKKLDTIKSNIISDINKIASANGTFSSANSILGGRLLRSAVFKIGEPCKTDGKDSKEITELNNSPVFTDSCLALANDKTSGAINAPTGIYIFTTIRKSLPDSSLKAEKYEKLKEALINDSANMITRNLLKDMSEKSKILKNLKTY